MRRLRFGIIRFASVTNAIADALNLERPPDCRLGDGRTRITFRQTGASRWTEQQQMEYALHVAELARRFIANDSRRDVRRLVKRAIVVIFEDTSLSRGCDLVSRWEAVIPAMWTTR
jgi:hypothetical protein